MKLARFSTGGGPQRLGVVEADSVADVLHTLPGLSPDLAHWLPAGPVAWRFLADLAATAPRIARDAVTFHAPVRPSKLLAIGANYQCHLDEIAHLGLKAMPHQIWFNKQVSSLNDPFADVIMPTISEQVDYEGELAVVIGRRARDVPEADALSVVGGYTICNDVSVRDIQVRTPTHTLGKSFDTHAPLGPWLVTADEITDPGALMLRTWVNGELRQEARTGTMIHSIRSQIAELSKIMTLEPGDVLATGTPAGVALSMRPPVWIKSGDVVRVGIDGIGEIQSRFV